jgi:hypothetical protein
MCATTSNDSGNKRKIRTSETASTYGCSGCGVGQRTGQCLIGAWFFLHGRQCQKVNCEQFQIPQLGLVPCDQCGDLIL